MGFFFLSFFLVFPSSLPLRNRTTNALGLQNLLSLLSLSLSLLSLSSLSSLLSLLSLLSLFSLSSEKHPCGIFTHTLLHLPSFLPSPSLLPCEPLPPPLLLNHAKKRSRQSNRAPLTAPAFFPTFLLPFHVSPRGQKRGTIWCSASSFSSSSSPPFFSTLKSCERGGGES